MNVHSDYVYCPLNGCVEKTPMMSAIRAVDHSVLSIDVQVCYILQSISMYQSVNVIYDLQALLFFVHLVHDQHRCEVCLQFLGFK